jgi:hypothetical protein
MSGMSLEPLQKAVYAALTADATLMAMVTGVYDRVPERTALPYLLFGQGEARDASTGTTEEEEARLELLAYSREGGRKQALDILERVHLLLHRQSPVLSGGYRLVWLRVEQAGAQMQSDGMTWRGIATLRAWVEKN